MKQQSKYFIEHNDRIYWFYPTFDQMKQYNLTNSYKKVDDKEFKIIEYLICVEPIEQTTTTKK